MSSTAIRLAMEKDAGILYKICCKLQLRPQNNIGELGFLMSDYASHPEMKGQIRDYISRDGLVALVAEAFGGIRGWLLGYSKDAWLKEGWSSGEGNILWTPDGERAIKEDFVLLEKVGVDPAYQGNGIATELYNYFIGLAQKEGINNVFSEAVEDVLEKRNGDLHSLGIKNTCSIGFFEAMGATRVGNSINPYHYEKSFLGESGYFLDGIYLAKIDKK